MKYENQIPIEFDIQPATSRDDLVPSIALQAAVTMIDNWPHWPAPIVLLVGPTGSGKTHLARIWQQQSSAQPISLAQPLEQYLEQPEGISLLLEDIDQNPIDEQKLFHLINATRSANATMLITSRSWPSTWQLQLPDLISRLKALTNIEIGEPDEELLSHVIYKLFADRQIIIDDKIVNYLVKRMERSLGAAQQIVERMDQMAFARKKPISYELARDVLNEFDA